MSGKRGEFSVRLDGKIVSRKTIHGFPTPEQVVDALRDALNDTESSDGTP